MVLGKSMFPPGGEKNLAVLTLQGLGEGLIYIMEFSPDPSVGVGVAI